MHFSNAAGAWDDLALDAAAVGAVEPEASNPGIPTSGCILVNPKAFALVREQRGAERSNLYAAAARGDGGSGESRHVP